MSKVTCAPRPCASCPYRKDVPSGIWHHSEYDKLPAYDGEISDQMFAGAIHLFMCHQKDGHLCAGWVAAHGPQELLAIRLNSRKLHKSVFTYKTDIPVFKSGSEALRHGIRDLHDPNARARRLMAKLIEKGKGAVE